MHIVSVGEHAAHEVPTHAPLGHAIGVLQRPFTQVCRVPAAVLHLAPFSGHSAQKSAVPLSMQPSALQPLPALGAVDHWPAALHDCT